MSQSVSGIRDITASIDLGGSGSLQFTFAKLQLALSMVSKENAMQYIDRIKDTQEEQKRISAMLQELRQSQATAKAGKCNAEISPETHAYMKDNGLAIPKSATKGNDEKSATVVEMLGRFKGLQNAATNGTGDCTWDKNASMMSQKDADFLKANGITYDTTGNDNAHNSAEWKTNIEALEKYRAKVAPYTPEDMDIAIQSMQARLDRVGSDTQQLMVFVSDFMGQYNSYLQGGSSVIQQANQTLGELARVR